MLKTFYIIRGLPGSGKNTFANTLDCVVFSADDYFIQDGNYKFIASLLPDAHADCKNRVRRAMYEGVDKIAVANTFTQEWEMEEYLNLASSHDYRVFSIIVENRHGGKNIHGVSDETIDKMRDRFEVQL